MCEEQAGFSFSLRLLSYDTACFWSRCLYSVRFLDCCVFYPSFDSASVLYFVHPGIGAWFRSLSLSTFTCVYVLIPFFFLICILSVRALVCMNSRMLFLDR